MPGFKKPSNEQARGKEREEEQSCEGEGGEKQVEKKEIVMLPKNIF